MESCLFPLGSNANFLLRPDMLLLSLPSRSLTGRLSPQRNLLPTNGSQFRLFSKGTVLRWSKRQKSFVTLLAHEKFRVACYWNVLPIFFGMLSIRRYSRGRYRDIIYSRWFGKLWSLWKKGKAYFWRSFHKSFFKVFYHIMTNMYWKVEVIEKIKSIRFWRHYWR